MNSIQDEPVITPRQARELAENFAAHRLAISSNNKPTMKTTARALRESQQETGVMLVPDKWLADDTCDSKYTASRRGHLS